MEQRNDELFADSEHLGAGELVRFASRKLDFGGGARINIGGRGPRRGSAFKSHPIVLFSILDDGPLFHEEIFAAIDLLESASGAFRVVVFSDSPLLSAARAYGWTVEHIMSESHWTRVNETVPWLGAVQQRYRWLVDTYGVEYSCVIDSHAKAREELEQLARHFAISEKLLASALDKLGGASGLGSSHEHRDWRGWLTQVPYGESSHYLASNPEAILEIHRGRQDSAVLCVGTSAADEPFEPFLESARSLGWTIGYLRQPGELARGVVGPFFGALGRGGLRVIASTHDTGQYAMTMYDALDGVVWVDDAGNLVCQTSYGRRIEGSEIADTAVLSRLDAIRRLSRSLVS